MKKYRLIAEPDSIGNLYYSVEEGIIFNLIWLYVPETASRSIEYTENIFNDLVKGIPKKKILKQS